MRNPLHRERSKDVYEKEKERSKEERGVKFIRHRVDQAGKGREREREIYNVGRFIWGPSQCRATMSKDRGTLVISSTRVKKKVASTLTSQFISRSTDLKRWR